MHDVASRVDIQGDHRVHAGRTQVELAAVAGHGDAVRIGVGTVRLVDEQLHGGGILVRRQQGESVGHHPALPFDEAAVVGAKDRAHAIGDGGAVVAQLPGGRLECCFGAVRVRIVGRS